MLDSSLSKMHKLSTCILPGIPSDEVDWTLAEWRKVMGSRIFNLSKGLEEMRDVFNSFKKKFAANSKLYFKTHQPHNVDVLFMLYPSVSCNPPFDYRNVHYVWGIFMGDMGIDVWNYS